MRAKTIIDGLFVAARDHESNGKMSLAAAIYKRNKLISMGYNNYLKSHTFQWTYRKDDFKCYWHAETNAIWNAKGVDLKGATLYVCRANFFGQGSAKPCEGCFRCIRDFGISTIVFSLTGEGYGIIHT